MANLDLTRRLWRVRRRHDAIDAYVSASDAGWTLQFFRKGRVLGSYVFDHRDAAIAAADARLREF